MADIKQDVVDLTRRLVRFDTINPPGREIRAMEFCASWLRAIGFDCTLHHHCETRASLVATRDTGEGLPICFSGHLDTVPLGDAPWRYSPFAGKVEDGRLFGRGSSDMKGAIAAFMLACREATPAKGGIAIVLTAGEETGCDGARWLAEAGLLPHAGAMIIGESSDNRALAGHKGAYWLKLTASGKTAHGATPELGVNAILKMAPLLDGLGSFNLDAHHPIMGSATLNPGRIRGGANINSVPDRCELTLDVRTVQGVSHSDVLARVKQFVGPEIDVEVLLDLPPVWSDPAESWFAKASQTASRITGTISDPAVANYFTDASVLKPAMNDIPVMILGPGSSDQPHRTDEYVLVSRLVEAMDIYGTLLREWGH